MKLGKLGPVLHVLLWIRAALCLPEPPTNVSLSCGNLQNTLHWNYDQHLPGLKFRVEIIAYYGSKSHERWVDSPAHQADLSDFSLLNEDYLVSVSAVLGKNESALVPSDGYPYTYSIPSTMTNKCSLDMPSVNLTALHDDIVEVCFEHPWLWYNLSNSNFLEKKRRRKKSHDTHHKGIPAFEYRVAIDSESLPSHEYHHSCVNRVCTQRFPVQAELDEHCLRITGNLKGTFVRSTQTHCVASFVQAAPKDNTTTIAVVVVVSIVSVVLFILFLVYKKKTRPGSSFPNAITIGRSTMSPMVVEPTSPSPLLNNEETSLQTVTPSSELPEHCLSNGGIINNNNNEEEDAPDEAEAPGDAGQDYRRTNSLEEDQPQNEVEAEGEAEGEGEAPCGYEQRPMLVDMGPGDVAEGYGPLGDDSGQL